MALFRKKNQEKAEKKKLNKSNIKRLVGIYRFMAPYRMAFIAGLISLFFSSTILLAFPYFTGKLIDTSLGEAQWILNDINKISLALVVVLAVQGTFSFLRIYFFARVNERAMADIRKSLYKKYMTLPVPFYDQRRSGELMSRITADVSLLQDTFSTTLSELIRQIAVLVFGTLILFVTNYQLTLFMLATFPILVIVGMVFGKFIRKLSKKTQDALADANVIVEETIQAVNTVKAFTNERFEVKRYRNALDIVVSIALKAANFRGAFVSFIIFALFGGIVLVLWYGSTLVAEGAISIGDLTSFIIYTMFIGGSIGGLGDIYGSLQRAIGASDRVQEILEEDSEEVFTTEVSDNHRYSRFEGHISLKNVSFSYPTRHEVPVLKDISFDVQAGERVALVGHSGAGKSTIIQLLLRFYQIDGGHISIDNKAIETYDLRHYRENIGIVPQEVILFGGTIRENIAYGNPYSTEEQILEAAERANALEFINRFPDKLETIVGERGIKLSGGQRQRIAIARAILKNPAILILDEATSSLDAEAERMVQDALNELMKGRTTIVIAHRLATIRQVDKIYVIDKGKIFESGTHDELAQVENGIYSNLLKLQFEGQMM